MEEKRTKKEIHEDYDGFVSKFQRKKTTDDCMTPPAVYDVALQWIRTHCREELRGFTPVRPFWPDAEYTQFSYPTGCALFTSRATFLTTRPRFLVDALTSLMVPVTLSSILSENFTSLLAILSCFCYIWCEVTNETYYDYCIPSLFICFPLCGIAICCGSILTVLLL